MKTLRLTKVIVSTLIAVSALALNPIGANAEWRKDNTGWWYTEGNSWVTGWKQIDRKWYYFRENGYMACNTNIDGYYLNANGEWNPNEKIGAGTILTYQNDEIISSGSFKFDKTVQRILKYTGTDTTLVIPSTIDGVSVTSIAEGAFSNSTNLKTVIIPEGVRTIGPGAFYGCINLTSVTIPNSVNYSIANAAFAKCNNLTNINANENSAKIVREQIQKGH